MRAARTIKIPAHQANGALTELHGLLTGAHAVIAERQHTERATKDGAS